MSKKYRHTYTVSFVIEDDVDCSKSIKQWMEHPDVDNLEVEKVGVEELTDENN